MKNIRKIKLFFWFAVLFQLLMSVSILLMPIAVQMGQQYRKMTILIGLVFWISAIAGYVMTVIANLERKWYIKQKVDGNVKMNCRAGITHFFENVPATIADVIMFMSLLLFVFLRFTEWKYEYISYILLFMLIFSLHMHCMFNGRIYKVIKL